MIDNGNGTVTDEATGLMWQQETAMFMAWTDALSYCEKLSLAGYTDWRLPLLTELNSIIDDIDDDDIDDKLEINRQYFPRAVASFYWSSTISASNTRYAWGVSFNTGNNHETDKNGHWFVRAVRNVYRTGHKKEQLTLF
jgi:hypothetical protein